MQRSRGRISRKSRQIGRKTRARKISVAELIKELPIGAKVQLVPQGRFENFPAPRYAGRVGHIIGQRGSAYIVEIQDGGLIKRIIAMPVHLKLV